MNELAERIKYYTELLNRGKGEWGAGDPHYIRDETWASWTSTDIELRYLRDQIQRNHRIFTLGPLTLMIRRGPRLTAPAG